MIQPIEPDRGAPETDPTAMLAALPPGAVIYGFSAEDGLDIEVLVREESRRIAPLPDKPDLQLRAGISEANNVLVVVVLFAFEPDRTVYQSFWNYHHPPENPEDGNIFAHMAGCEEFVLRMIGDAGLAEKILTLKNPLRTFFSQAIKRIEMTPPWSMQEFASALDAVRGQFSNPLELWDAL